MKNIKNALPVLVAFFSVLSCTKGIEPEPDKGNLIINAVAGNLGKSDPDSKAIGSFGYDILWEGNDRISVIDGSGNTGLFNLIEGEGETLGKFQQVEGTMLSGTVNGYYPASLLQDDGTLCWPAEQTYSKELTGIPMTATATIADGGTNFNFKNLGGVLQLVLTSEEGEMPMKSITVSAGNSGLSGAFTISDGAATGFASGTSITLDCEGLVIGTAAKTVNISIPAGNYSDIQLTFAVKDGRVGTLTSSSLNIKRSVVSKVTLALSGFKSDYPDYLSLTASGANVSVGLKKTGTPTTMQLEYCFDVNSGIWTSWTADASVSGVQNITIIDKGQTIFLRTKTERTSMSGWTFDFGSGSGKVAAGGSIMSLLDPAAASTKVGAGAFAQLFKGASALISAPALPAVTLGEGCYESMFEGCTGLTEAPELPAAYLAARCYKSMFKGSGLRSTSDMRASSLAENCCEQMYMDCKSLVSAQTLTATKLGYQCYYEMFKGCTALQEAPALPARDLAEDCYRSMFESCSSLVKACELPAMNLAVYCYLDMFLRCISLSEAPVLPAMNLEDGCYSGMFMYCSSLVKAPELPATTLAENCYSFMFDNCTALEYAPYLPSKNLVGLCYFNMFRSCGKLKCVSVNFSVWEDNCTSSWMGSVGKSGTFYCPSGLDDSIRDSHHIPAGWTVITDKTPSKVGDLYWSEGVEGVYIGNGLVFATCNYGARESNEFGNAYSKAQLNALTIPAGWELPTETDINALENLAGLPFIDDGKGTTKMIVESIQSIGADTYWYYIPYTHDVEYVDEESGETRKGKEARLWITGSAPYDFYWFRSDNWHGKTDFDTSSNYLRLVKRL